MKKARMIIRLLAWPCFIVGLAMVVSWAILERRPGFEIPIVSGMEIEKVFYLGVGLGFLGLVVALIVEDDSSWGSICRLFEKGGE